VRLQTREDPATQLHRHGTAAILVSACNLLRNLSNLPARSESLEAYPSASKYVRETPPERRPWTRQASSERRSRPAHFDEINPEGGRETKNVTDARITSGCQSEDARFSRAPEWPSRRLRAIPGPWLLERTSEAGIDVSLIEANSAFH